MFSLIGKLFFHVMTILIFNWVGILIIKLYQRIFSWSEKGIHGIINNFGIIAVYLLIVCVIFMGLDKDVDELIAMVMPNE